MIESVWLLLRLAAGLGSIEVAGYALLLLVLPRQSRFTPLERLTFAFGLGSFGITMWMLLLTFGTGAVLVGDSCGSLAGPGGTGRVAGLEARLAQGGRRLALGRRVRPVDTGEQV